MRISLKQDATLLSLHNFCIPPLGIPIIFLSLRHILPHYSPQLEHPILRYDVPNKILFGKLR